MFNERLLFSVYGFPHFSSLDPFVSLRLRDPYSPVTSLRQIKLRRSCTLLAFHQHTRYMLMNASDVIRDGLGVELVDQNQQTVAEVFRHDPDQTVVVSTFNNDIPLDAMEQLLSYARRYLEPFENGKPLDEASNFGQLQNKAK